MRCNKQFSRDIIVILNDNELLEYMSVHDNDAFENSQPSWGKIVYVVNFPRKVAYTTLLSMVCVTYSAYQFYLRWLASTSTSLLLIYCSTSDSSSTKLHHSFRICLRYGCWFGGKRIQKLHQKGVYEESFSRHVAWIGRKLIQPMHTTMVPEQVETLKFQAGVQVSRLEELKRHLQLWKRFGRLYFCCNCTC
ncbi:hypothetical protein Tco_0331094 [Tanacetum coccineum]